MLIYSILEKRSVNKFNPNLRIAYLPTFIPIPSFACHPHQSPSTHKQLRIDENVYCKMSVNWLQLKV